MKLLQSRLAAWMALWLSHFYAILRHRPGHTHAYRFGRPKGVGEVRAEES